MSDGESGMSVYGAGANWKSLKQKVMLGGKQISKIYAGNTLIYPEKETDTEPEEQDFLKYAMWTELSEPVLATIDYNGTEGIDRREMTIPITRFGKYIFFDNARDVERITSIAFSVIRGPASRGAIKRCWAQTYVGLSAYPRNNVHVSTFAANGNAIILSHAVPNNGYKLVSRVLSPASGQYYLYEGTETPLFSFRIQDHEEYLLMENVHVSDPDIMSVFCAEDGYTDRDVISFITDGRYS